MTARLILTSCGTSLLTNRADADFRRQLIGTANVRDAEANPEAAALVARRAAEVGARLAAADAATARSLSAEINSLLAFESEASFGGPADHHVLVHTDTLQGEAAAALVARWLELGSRVVRLLTVPGLRTDEIDEFRMALTELAKQLVDEIAGWRDAGATVHFNLTGGFKGMQGFLQALGFVLADEVLYLFEGSSSLLRIPRLPLALAADHQLLGHLDLLRRLAVGAPQLRAALRDLPETLTEAIGEDVQLSPWGHMLFAKLAETAYRERLLEPISAKLVLGPRLRDAAKRLPPDRLAQLNRQLDQFAAYLEGWRPFTKSLGFKPLKGAPMPGLSHEIYAWSDRDAARMFGRYLSDCRFAIERLDAHL